MLPNRIEEFRFGIDRAASYAQALGCWQVNCLAGLAPAGAARAELEAVFVENLRYAAERLGEAGIRLLIEPINDKIDMPGFFLTRTRQALDIIDKVGSSNLFLQYDIYHMQIMEGDIARTIEANLARIAHVQIAGHPGRHEPDIGEINYPFLFEHLDSIGYRGWVGAEYRPRGRTEDGLAWLPGGQTVLPRS